MPDIGGLELAQRIRKDGGPNALTRLIAFTAADIDTGSSPAGFDACLKKPVHPRELAALVGAMHPTLAAHDQSAPVKESVVPT